MIRLGLEEVGSRQQALLDTSGKHVPVGRGRRFGSRSRSQLGGRPLRLQVEHLRLQNRRLSRSHRRPPGGLGLSRCRPSTRPVRRAEHLPLQGHPIHPVVDRIGVVQRLEIQVLGGEDPLPELGPEGEHRIEVEVGLSARLDVRTMPEIAFCYYPSSRHITAFPPYDWEYVGRYVLPHVNTLITRSKVPQNEFEQWLGEGRQWISNAGLPGLTSKEAPAADDVYVMCHCQRT